MVTSIPNSPAEASSQAPKLPVMLRGTSISKAGEPVPSSSRLIWTRICATGVMICRR
jgi:hypothetical protein